MTGKYRYYIPKITHVITLVILSSVLIGIAGYTYYINEEKTIQQQKQNELKAIAQLKIEQISGWYIDELADAKIISHNSFLIENILKFTNNNSSAEKSYLTKLISEIKAQHGYEDILITSLQGELLTATNINIHPIDSIIKAKISKSINSNSIVASDLYIASSNNGNINLAFISPIVNSDNRIIASAVFILSANKFLFPLIQYMPIQSRTSETYLFRKEGDDKVIYLNNVRHRKNTALKFTLPMTRKELPAIQAALGKVGIFEGRDYRGIEVFAYLSPIPGTNWYMVAKIDKSELFEGLYDELIIISIMTLMFIILTGIGISLIYSSRQKNFYKELYNKERELWQSEEKFKVTIESLGNGVITTDTFGKIQYLNKMAEELTGWNSEEAKGKNLCEIYSIQNENTGEKENNIIDKVLRQGVVKELGNHTLLVSRSGEKIPVRDTGAPIYDTDGSISGLVLTFQDETEKRNQLNLLKESEEKYRTLIEIARDALFIDLDDKIVFVNNAAIKTFGAENAEQLIGRSPLDFVQPDTYTINAERKRKMLKEGISLLNIEERITRLDGITIDVEVASIPFVFKNKTAIQVMFRDITELKKVERQRKMALEALRESEERYRHLFEEAPVGIVVVIENIISFINPAAVNLLGYDSSYKLLNKSYLEIIPPEKISFTQERFDQLLKGKEGLYPIEEIYPKADGSQVQLEILATTFKYNGKQAIHVIFTDITERKKMINDLVAAKEKAEEINKLKTHFFANMSHELRTPFVGIMGYAELLLECLTDPDQKVMAEGILTTSIRMKETLTKILNLTRFEFSGIEVSKNNINLHILMENIYKQFKNFAEKKNLFFKFRLGFNSFFLYTDESLLSEILSNIISNAIIYTNDGEVILTAEVTKRNGINYVVIKVSDSGIGIPADKQEIIWEEFRQVSEGTTRSYQGTGLGLAIVKKYTKLLDGNIYLESQEGKGSTFILELPAPDVSESEIESEDEMTETNNCKPESNPAKNFEKKKILYVEDDLIAVDIAKRTLSKTYEIDFTNTAETALSKINEKNYDLILTDINLGAGENGQELTQLIRQHPNYKNIPIVAVTAFASDEDKNKFLSKGMTHFLAKPFYIREMIKLLEDIFNTNK